jgi:hypothetical protein
MRSKDRKRVLFFRQVETDQLKQIVGLAAACFECAHFFEAPATSFSCVKLGHFAVVFFLPVVLRRRIFVAGIGLLAVLAAAIRPFTRNLLTRV